MLADELTNYCSGREAVSQVRVNALLRSGIIFSLLWLMGVGSAIALSRGLEARRLIRGADHHVGGMGGAWWCIVVGAAGVLLWIPYWAVVALR